MITTVKSFIVQPQYFWLRHQHRHLSNIDCLTARTTCLVCPISTVNGHSKKKRKKAKNVALVAGTQQTLSNIFFLSISMVISDEEKYL
jgi:hypothetical protein